MCVCYVARRRLDGVAVRVSRRLRVVAETLSRRRAPAVRSATAVLARVHVLSLVQPSGAVLGPDAVAHVKILVSHGQRGEPRCTSLAARRCASVRNSKFMAARVGWRPLVGPQRALLEAKTPRSLAIEAKS